MFALPPDFRGCRTYPKYCTSCRQAPLGTVLAIWFMLTNLPVFDCLFIDSQLIGKVALVQPINLTVLFNHIPEAGYGVF